MNLFKDLRDVFKIKTLDFKKQTRKKLLKWAADVQFEKRRETFYEASCHGKIQSRVSICQKKGKRPDWTRRLEMLKTADLRLAIKTFLFDLGLLGVSEKTNYKKLAEKKHWSRVLLLDKEALKDTEKKGGTGSLGRSRSVSRRRRRGLSRLGEDGTPPPEKTEERCWSTQVQCSLKKS